METVFNPSEDVSAVLSLYASSQLSLKPQEGLNGCPEEYYPLFRHLDCLGLTSHPVSVRLLSSYISQGVAVAMASAPSLDRIASVLDNRDLVRNSEPPLPDHIPPSSDPPDPSSDPEGLPRGPEPPP